jgi:hypothetical protein
MIIFWHLGKNITLTLPTDHACYQKLNTAQLKQYDDIMCNTVLRGT